MADSGRVIGEVGLTCLRWGGHDGYLGFIVMPEEWRKGYATEATVEMLHFAFEELGLPVVYGGCTRDNHASRRVLEKLGMRYLGPCLGFPGSPPGVDSLAFVLRREAWMAQRLTVAH